MTKMYEDLRKSFWWPGMKNDVARFVASCLTCQRAKTEHQRPGGLLQQLEIPEWKWDSVSMDFVTHLPRTVKNHDSIWVIVDRLTKSAHFLPVNLKMSMTNLAKLYIREIVRELGSKLQMSSAYHPQTDDQSERTIQTHEDLLRTCVLDHLGAWDEVLLLVEFTYNNSFQSSIGMAPFEALYGRKCRTPLCRAVRPKKLSPKFVGPYQILRKIGPVAYELSLPPQLSNLHPVFHVSQLRKYIADPSHILELEDVRLGQDWTLEMQPVRVEDSRTKYYRGKDVRLVKMVWNEKTGDSTWEVEDAMKDLYPHLFPRIKLSSLLKVLHHRAHYGPHSRESLFTVPALLAPFASSSDIIFNLNAACSRGSSVLLPPTKPYSNSRTKKTEFYSPAKMKMVHRMHITSPGISASSSKIKPTIQFNNEALLDLNFTPVHEPK
ncbi:uncharacterized protein LOC128195006 [Vigna angularis]|uniref:uncharacterized protein LOC128195006 n=1 Tax=Phaseolus angularis TaxID=3914 RepID=UPI0022B301EE|nr:uncharacterized protein LOC128195006 [Vigna angularis]